MIPPQRQRGLLRLSHHPANDNFSRIRVGVNHYFLPESDAAKLSIDLSWFLDAQDKSIVPANTQTGLLASDKDSQFNLRAQIQLMF